MKELSIGSLDEAFASTRPGVEKLTLLFSIVGQYTSQSEFRRGAEIDEEALMWHDIVLNNILSSGCEINGNYEHSLENAIGNCLLNGLCKR
jgi:hypothetical protein